MAVRDLNAPAGNVVSPDAKPMVSGSPEDPAYWQRQASIARAQREYVNEQKAMQLAENPPPSEPPFSVRGSVNLGDINLMEAQDKARQDAEQYRKEAAEREREINAELAKTKAELADTKTSAMMKELSSQLLTMQEKTNQAIAAVAAGKSNDMDGIFKMLDLSEKLANKMGYSPRSAPTGDSPQFNDARLQIEMMRLKAEEAARQRQFELDMKKYDIEIARQNKLDDRDYILRDAELKQKANRDGMLADLPNLFGRAIARGMMDNGGEGANPFVPPTPAPAHVAAAVAPAAVMATNPINISAAAAPPTSTKWVSAGMGEAGTMQCPNCDAPMTIAPDSVNVNCARCGTTLEVRRTANV